MALLGRAAIAMWWDVAPTHRAEFEDWHSHEHFPERLSIPGFLRGSRWSSTTEGEGFFGELYTFVTQSYFLPGCTISPVSSLYG